jgi:hypothetical protein
MAMCVFSRVSLAVIRTRSTYTSVAVRRLGGSHRRSGCRLEVGIILPRLEQNRGSKNCPAPSPVVTPSAWESEITANFRIFGNNSMTWS